MHATGAAPNGCGAVPGALSRAGRGDLQTVGSGSVALAAELDQHGPQRDPTRFDVSSTDSRGGCKANGRCAYGRLPFLSAEGG